MSSGFLPAVRVASGSGGVGSSVKGGSSSSSNRVTLQTAPKVAPIQQPLIDIHQHQQGGTTTTHAPKATKLREQLQQAQAYAEQGTLAPSASRTRSSRIDDSPPPALGLRIVDARFDTADEPPIDQTTLWAQLNLDQINAGLAEPLTRQEVALNNVRRGVSGKRKEDVLAEQAHRGIDVSRLVPHYPLRFGSALVGGRANVLFLQLENTASPAPRSAGVTTPLDTIAGEVVWRARFPNELETKVDHWAMSSGNSTDEDRYHAACVEREIFTIRPSSGRLAPGESMTLEITYHPKFVGEHVLPLLMQVRGGKHFSLLLKGETVQHFTSTFSFEHLGELPAPPPDSDESITTSAAKDEEQKESSSLIVSTPSNPFLPSSSPPHLFHCLHRMPIGLRDSESPWQTFLLRNATHDTLDWRIEPETIQQLAAANFNFPILELESYSGSVLAGTIGRLRLRFRPLEVKEYRLPLPILVRGAAARTAATQLVTLVGSGITPHEWALTPFPHVTSRPSRPLLERPGELLQVSTDDIDIGDVPLFSKTSRIFTLRSLSASDVEFVFLHRLRRRRDDWDESLRSDRLIRASIDPDSLEDEFGGEIDPFETVHVVFTPAVGVIAPGQTVQVRMDLYGGPTPTVLEATAHIMARVTNNGESGDIYANNGTVSDRDGGVGVGMGFGASVGTGVGGVASDSNNDLDVFGYNRTSSLSLTNRSLVSSSQSPPHRRPRVRVGTSVIGVGSGHAGQDVRVDYPPRPASKLHSSTITHRMSDATPRTTQHLSSSLSSLSSVPNRATWFVNPSEVVESLRNKVSDTNIIKVRGRILTNQQIEQDERRRREAALEEILPQQARTEATIMGTQIEHRFFVPRVTLNQPHTLTASSPTAAHTSVATDQAGWNAVESTLHRLLLDSLGDTSVIASFDQLESEPIPFFTDLLDHASQSHPHAGSHAHPTGSGSAVGVVSVPPSSLSTSSAHFQNLSQSILNDALFNLMTEAAAEQSKFSLDRPIPKTFIKRNTPKQ